MTQVASVFELRYRLKSPLNIKLSKNTNTEETVLNLY